MNIFLANIKNLKPDDVDFNALTTETRAKCERLYAAAPQKAVSAAVSELMLAYVKKQYNVTGETKKTAEGKPYFENSDVFISVSHSKDVVAVCAHDGNCGLDVQVFTLPTRKTVEASLNAAELSAFDDLSEESEKTKLFTRFFTEKESYVKYLGTGFTTKPCEIKSYPGVKFLTKYLFITSDVYCLTVCAEKIERATFGIVTPEMLGI